MQTITSLLFDRYVQLLVFSIKQILNRVPQDTICQNSQLTELLNTCLRIKTHINKIKIFTFSNTANKILFDNVYIPGPM